MTGGRGSIWLSLPFLNGEGDEIAIKWWGDAPDYDPTPTIQHTKAFVDFVCREFGGDRNRIILAGF